MTAVSMLLARSVAFSCICYFLSFALAIPLDQSHDDNAASHTPANRLLKRDDSPDFDDNSWVQKYTALGDSYSAGIGAGTRLKGFGDYFCSRYNESFSSLINSDSSFGLPGEGRLSNYACSEAVTQNVIKQANSLADESQDLITISSGGNDAKLVEILDKCIFGWSGRSAVYERECPEILSAAQDVIHSSDFHNHLDTLIGTTKHKLTSNGTMYWVGYAQFFGEADTQCDSQTWMFWYDAGGRISLTLENRKRMNTLVRNMNGAIRDAVSRANAPEQVVFVDYGRYCIDLKGRFCEGDYPETQPNRGGLLLYEYHTEDNKTPDTVVLDSNANNVSTSLAPSTDLVMNGTFEGVISDYARSALASDFRLRPRLTSNASSSNTQKVNVSSTNPSDEQLKTGYTSEALLPDTCGRIFHPRPDGHAIIAKMVLWEMSVTGLKKAGKEVPEEVVEFNTCPVRVVPVDQRSPNGTVVPVNAAGSTFGGGFANGTTNAKGSGVAAGRAVADSGLSSTS